MKKLLIVILILSLTGCTYNPSSYNGLRLPEDTEYNQIICEILNQDTTFINKGAIISNYINSDLIKLQIKFVPPQNDTANLYEIQTIPDLQTSIFQLIYYKITNSINRNNDSIYFAFQNDSAKNISINKECNNFIKLTTSEIDAKIKSAKHFSYFQFSLPILNSAQNKAFVRGDFFGAFGGEGMTFILEKRNKKWKLLLSKSRWVT